jgi:hypothetical protein
MCLSEGSPWIQWNRILYKIILMQNKSIVEPVKLKCPVHDHTEEKLWMTRKLNYMLPERIPFKGNAALLGKIQLNHVIQWNSLIMFH